MNHRTTFALDEETAQRFKRLAARWNVSQAVFVRRSVLQADCIIAATSTVASEPLATLNRTDFEPFLAHGLELFWPHAHMNATETDQVIPAFKELF